MRSLSPTLLAAQKDASSLPFVKVTVSDKIADVPRLRWERLYAGSEADAHHAVAMPDDGSLLRLRVDPAGPTLYEQRIVSPDDESDYDAWSSLGAVADAGVAMSSNGDDVVRAYVAANGSDIKVEDSSDDGATFGSAVIAASLADVAWLAISLKSSGDAVLLYADATTVYAVRRASGTWGTPSAWPHSANSITGLAVALSGDFNVAIAGTDTSDNPRLWTAIYGDGVTRTADTWSGLSVVEEADDGSDVSFRAPFLTFVDTARLTFVEAYDGTVAYSQPRVSWFAPGDLFESNAWREPVPFDLDSASGIAMTGSLTHAWLSTPAGVWRAPISATPAELSADVRELSFETARTRGSVTITIRNDDGRYNDLPAGDFSAIRRGAQIDVRPGFLTSEGEETCAPALKYWVRSWEHTSSGGEAALVLHADDAWSLVERWRARSQHTWPAGDKSVAQILSFVFARSGIDLLNVSASTIATNHKPSFTIHPGESGSRAVQRLLAMVPDTIRMVDAFAYLTETEATDSSDYTYGTDHRILHARYVAAGPASNRVQVFGNAVFAQDFDWADIGDQTDNLRQVFDLNLDSQSEAEDRAATALRQEALAVALGELVTALNCGQDLYDVITVTDEAAGLSGATFRVAGIQVRYARQSRFRRSPLYEQRLLLTNA